MTTADNVLVPAAGTWYFLTAWYDSGGGTINMQINNGTVRTNTISVTPNASATPFLLGEKANAVTALNGRLDNRAVWKRAHHG